MDSKSLHILEYPKVKQMLHEYAASRMGISCIEAMEPSADRETVLRWQQETTEAVRVLRSGASILGGLHDTREEVKRAEMGSILDPAALVALALSLQVSRRVKRWFHDHREDYVVLHDVVMNLGNFIDIEDAVASAIDDRGEVSDNASADLKRIRREILSMQQRIRERLENMIRNPALQKHLQDSLLTIRNDRFVLPVKLESRSAVPGLVHDTSGSGSTLFIEPMAVVEMNNDLRRLESEEREEIARILKVISQKIAAVAQDILVSMQALAELDMIFSRAHLSLAMSAVEPEISDDLSVDIRLARHPLLKGDVVPIDIMLGDHFTILLITGPNTGGKTVSLKTLGLLQLMAQSGMHIPASYGSKVALFENIFADIGDEQSIEQSLSTFSSHMTNIVRIFLALTPQTLVLLDELGAGTDPAEGAALAMSILDELLLDEVRTVATTHYSELKAFAYNRSGVENGSVEFNIDTLKPTYKLLIGIPGHSNAFEISRRLGLSDRLIESAKGMVGSDQLAVEDLINSLEENQRQSQHARLEADRMRREIEKMKADMEAEKEQSRIKMRESVQKAQSEGAALINQARREAEEILGQLRSMRSDVSERELTRLAQHSRQTLRGLGGKIGGLGAVDSDLLSGEAAGLVSFQVGDVVWLRRYEIEATVLGALNDKDELPVQAGSMKLSVPLDEVGRINRQARRNRQAQVAGEGLGPSTRSLVQEKSDAIRMELDLRGKNLEEAIEMVDKFLDDSYLGNYPKVRIIHGKGTGVLRKGIREYLRRHAHVKTYEFAPFHEGGDGVTIVELK